MHYQLVNILQKDSDILQNNSNIKQNNLNEVWGINNYNI